MTSTPHKRQFNNSTNKSATKSTSKTNRLPQSPVSPSLFNNRTPAAERYKVRMANNRDKMTKEFRKGIRDVYHETDQFAIFQQNSALILPIELTPSRILLGHYVPRPESTPKKSTRGDLQTTTTNIKDLTDSTDIKNDDLNEVNKNQHFELPENLQNELNNQKEETQNVDSNIVLELNELPTDNETSQTLIETVQIEIVEESLPADDSQNKEEQTPEEDVNIEILNDVEILNTIEENIEIINDNEEDINNDNEEDINNDNEEDIEIVNGNEEENQNEIKVDQIEEEESDNDASNTIPKEIDPLNNTQNDNTEEENAHQNNSQDKIEEEESESEALNEVIVEEESDNDDVQPEEQQQNLTNDDNSTKDKNADTTPNESEDPSPFMPPPSPPRHVKLDRNDPTIEHFGEQLLEISAVPYLYSLSIKYNKPIKSLKDIPDTEFNDWQSMGFNWIWLCGAWQIGENIIHHDLTDKILLDRYKEILPDWTEEDVVGYPLCIYKYSVNPRLGTVDDLIWFRKELSIRGIKLMLDFVPNDTAIDAPEMSSHPDFYIRSLIKPRNDKFDSSRFMEKNNGVAYGAGKWMPPIRFTAQLNFFRNDVREYQINRMVQVSDLCDGFRIHLAQYLINANFAEYWTQELFTPQSPNYVDVDFKNPQNEFWLNAITRIRNQNPNFVLIAESYGYENQASLLNSGFNYVYEKELLDKLVFSDVNGFRNMIFNNKFITSKKMVHFVENHDEVRVLHRFWKNEKMACAGSAALLTLPGIRLFYFHQWLGYMNQVDVNLRRCFKPSTNATIAQFYKRLFRILDTNAIRYGNWYPLVVHNSESIIAWKWIKDDQHILVTVNINNVKSGGWIICDDVPENQKEVQFRELITHTIFMRNPNEMKSKGLNVILDEYQTQIFEY